MPATAHERIFIGSTLWSFEYIQISVIKKKWTDSEIGFKVLGGEGRGDTAETEHLAG